MAGLNIGAITVASGLGTVSQTYTGTTTVASTITANSLTSGKALSISSSTTDLTGNLLDITLSGAGSANTGSLLSLTNSGDINQNTTFYLKHYATGSGNLAFRIDDQSSDTTPLVIDGSGNLGIGTTAPTDKLDILGAMKIGASYAGSGTTAPNNGLLVEGNVGIGTTNPGYKLEVNGSAKFSCTTDANWTNGGTNPTCSDVAEMYPTDQELESGDVLAISTGGKVVKTTSGYQANVIGVYSTSPGLLVGDGVLIGTTSGLLSNPGQVPVALIGRVPVKISSASADISPGDFLATSDEDGKATKALQAGVVIGRSLEAWSAQDGKDKILTFINLSWYDPNLSFDQEGNLRIASNPKQENDQAGFSSLSASTALQAQVSVLTDSSLKNLTIGSLIVDSGLVNNDFMVSGKLDVKGSLVVEGPATLKSETLFERLTTFMSDVFFGGQVTFNTRPIFDEDSAGVAVVSKGTNSVDISFKKLYTQVPVVTISHLLPSSPSPILGVDSNNTYPTLYDDIEAAVTNVTEYGFTIILSGDAPADMFYNWMALVVSKLQESRSVSPQASPMSSTPTPTPTLASPSPTPISEIATPSGSPVNTPFPTPTPSP